MRLREELHKLEKNSYASDHIELPEGGVDCSEGCNPYGFPKEIEKVLTTFDPSRFAPYPHSTAAYDGICSYWKEQCRLKKENIMLSDGSIAALYIINNLFNIKNAKIMGIAPQFTDFVANVRLLGMDYKPIYMNKENNFRIDVDEIIRNISEDVSMLYIDNPNNPTGQILNSDDIEKILKKTQQCNVCLVVDEAYGDFMPKENSAVRFLNNYENLIVVRTLSKGFGLAGLRAGYILASESLISCMNKVSNPYQIGEFTRELVGAALNSDNHIEEHMQSFARQKRILREFLGDNLEMAATGDTVSICMIYHKDTYVNLYREFLKEGVLTVPGAEFEGLNSAYVRIRMPKMEEFDVLKKAVEKINQG